MTTAADNCAVDLGRGSYAGMTPDPRVGDARAFFDIAAAAKNRVDDLHAGFDGAFVSDDREIVNFRVSRRIKSPAPILDVNARHAIREQIEMRLEIATQRAYVHPVRSLRNVREEGFAFFQQFRK